MPLFMFIFNSNYSSKNVSIQPSQWFSSLQRLYDILAPAPNNTGRNTQEEVDNTMLVRCRKIIHRAIENRCKVLVLGAFGCGAFRNSPTRVALIFRQLLVDEGIGKYFDLIVHPIFTKRDNDINYCGFEGAYKDIATFL